EIAHHENGQYDVIQVDVLAEVQAEYAAARYALQAILAMRKRRLQEEKENHLRHGERDHGEIDAAAAYGQPAHDQTHQGGHGGAEQQAAERRKTPYHQGMPGGISGAAQEGRVPERQQARITQQQIEGAGK